jgi:SH3-like domain-containing protein
MRLNLVWIAISLVLLPGQNCFPAPGIANSDDVNIRADATINSAIIAKLKKDQPIEIVSEFFDWYKISLPKDAPSYVRKDLTDCISTVETPCNQAKIAKERVNIRIGPAETYPIIGKANKSDPIIIVAEKGSWYKIIPLPNNYGWVNKKFIVKTIAAAEKKENLSSDKAADGAFRIIGIIKPYGKIIRRKATHKLISEDNTIFLLRGEKARLDALSQRKVKITGNKITCAGQKYPMIEILEIEEIK